MQAQEYEAAKWALGLRMAEGTVDADIQRAFDEGRILRTHVMRPTWHFVTPADIRWLLELTAPRVQRLMASYNRRLELDARTLTRTIRVFERALRDRCYLTRTELADCLQRAGMPMAGQRLAHVAMHAELEGVICSGPRRGKQFTYALLDSATGTSDTGTVTVHTDTGTVAFFLDMDDVISAAFFNGTNTSITVAFLSSPNETVTLEYTTDLVTWTTVSGTFNTGSGSFQATITAPGNLATQWNAGMFFRGTNQ